MLVVQFLWLTISIQTAQQKFQDYNALIVQKFAEIHTYKFLTFILKVYILPPRQGRRVTKSCDPYI